MRRVFLLWVDNDLIGVFSSEVKAWDYAYQLLDYGVWDYYESCVARVEERAID